MSDYIPAEVMSEILVKLPVKCIIQLRSVCKAWFCIISDTNFIAKHLALSSSKTLVRHYSKLYSKEIYTLFDDKSFNTENATRMSFPFHGRTQFYNRIVGSCNGVLCLSDDLFRFSETIMLWNPSIKKALSLPTPRVVLDRCGPYTFALGFGFDKLSNDYKVVRVAYLLPDSKRCRVIPPQVEVFSLSTGLWRPVENNVECYIMKHYWTQAFINGVVHWAGYKKSIIKNNYGVPWCNLILRFDLGSEKFDEIDLPRELTSRYSVEIQAITVKGKFAVLSNDYAPMNIRAYVNCYCDIWVMMKYGNVESWMRVFNIRLPTMALWMMLCFKIDDDIIFSNDQGELVSYNSEKEEVTGTGIHGTRFSFFVDKYVESLVLMDKGEVVRGKQPELDYEDVDNDVDKVEFCNICDIVRLIDEEINFSDV